MKHKFDRCKPDCDDPYCNICQGGLALCSVCRLYEGGLTTECPGVPVSADDSDRIYRGEVDFRDGQWVPGDGQMPCRNHQIQFEAVP